MRPHVEKANFIRHPVNRFIFSVIHCHPVDSDSRNTIWCRGVLGHVRDHPRRIARLHICNAREASPETYDSQQFKGDTRHGIRTSSCSFPVRRSPEPLQQDRAHSQPVATRRTADHGSARRKPLTPRPVPGEPRVDRHRSDSGAAHRWHPGHQNRFRPSSTACATVVPQIRQSSPARLYT